MIDNSANTVISYKERIFDHLSRIGKAVSSPKRIELLELLEQGERSVESISRETALSVANTSRHLLILRDAGLIQGRKHGTHTLYSVSNPHVRRLCDSLQAAAHTGIAGLDRLVSDFFRQSDDLEPVKREDLLERVRTGRSVALDVRPAEEFVSGHVPRALSIPLKDLERRLSELPRDKEIVAYCRGSYCILSTQAVKILRSHGFTARRMDGGFPQWREADLPIDKEA